MKCELIKIPGEGWVDPSTITSIDAYDASYDCGTVIGPRTVVRAGDHVTILHCDTYTRACGVRDDLAAAANAAIRKSQEATK